VTEEIYIGIGTPRFKLWLGGVKIIILKEITEDNFYDCIELQQSCKFVESAVAIVADAYVTRNYMTPYALCHNDDVVGLVSVRNEPAEHTKNYAFTEFFIADNYRGQGHGRAAVMALLAKLKGENGFVSARICVDVENEDALAFFKKCGFTEDGIAPWNDRYIDLSYSLQ